MYIVAIGWMYVILMMAITEESVVAGVMTFLLYGLLPLTVILYLGGTSRRKRRRAMAAAERQATAEAEQGLIHEVQPVSDIQEGQQKIPGNKSH
ncbi:MAG: hypothetical protein V4695_09525 [Pseudomonadota bacterium]